jgi:hypothetical protein
MLSARMLHDGVAGGDRGQAAHTGRAQGGQVVELPGIEVGRWVGGHPVPGGEVVAQLVGGPWQVDRRGRGEDGR